MATPRLDELAYVPARLAHGRTGGRSGEAGRHGELRKHGRPGHLPRHPGPDRLAQHPLFVHGYHLRGHGTTPARRLGRVERPQRGRGDICRDK